MLQIPIQAVAAQMVSVVLANQDCQISLYQKGAELYLDLVANERTIVSTRLVRNAVPLIRQPYLGFVGDLMLMDMQSNRDPEYQGLGERYRLYYIEANDLATHI